MLARITYPSKSSYSIVYLRLSELTCLNSGVSFSTVTSITVLTVVAGADWLPITSMQLTSTGTSVDAAAPSGPGMPGLTLRLIVIVNVSLSASKSSTGSVVDIASAGV